MDEIEARLACSHLSLPNGALLRAANAYSHTADIFAADREVLATLFQEKHINRIEKWRALSAVERTKCLASAFEKIETLGAQLLSVRDKNYPALLKEIPDPPALIYVCGDPEKLSRPQVAIVGSRRMTAAGAECATRFSSELAQAGIVITSGLAMGIDSCAHRGALSVGGDTLAVLGTGIDGRYPRTNQVLYDEILSSGGVLISEYPVGSPPRPENFPRRNRIITGLSMATLVVEANEKSGSLVSARLAAEQGREVFAVPGSIRSPASSGCHSLIRQGATLVTSPKQILEDIGAWMGLVFETSITSACEETENNSQAGQHWILAALGQESLSIEELCDRSDKPVDQVAAEVTQLEIRGLISRGPYGFQRIL